MDRFIFDTIVTLLNFPAALAAWVLVGVAWYCHVNATSKAARIMTTCAIAVVFLTLAGSFYATFGLPFGDTDLRPVLGFTALIFIVPAVPTVLVLMAFVLSKRTYAPPPLPRPRGMERPEHSRF